MDFAETVSHLRARLAGPLPGFEAQQRLAPDYRQDALLASVQGKRCREAGVLALLFPLSNQAPGLVLTTRRPDLRDHAGQVSFPGGRREDGEPLPETALREAREEVGLDPASVELLGPLTPLYIPPSNFCVYPFVGCVGARPALRPTDAEVADVLLVPLATLLDGRTLQRAPWTLHERTVEVPFFDVDGHRIWGATAMMLAELLALFTNSPPMR